MEDQLICVDAGDNPTRSAGKWECHRGQGIRHRAFSLFIQRADGRILFQQRSGSKPLWPKYWANSCCSHPRLGEDPSHAVRRRAAEELGLEIESPSWLFSFEYRAEYANVGVEHELCHVYLARTEGEETLNPEEVAAAKWLTAEEAEMMLRDTPEKFTPWLHLEWPRVRSSLRTETGLACTSS